MYSKKTVKTQLGEVDVKIPRDRNGEYEPQIIGKYNRKADGMEEKILAFYSCGMSQSDISEQIKNLYNVDISDGLASKIVEKITLEISAWQNRPLDAVYPFVFMDAIHYKVSYKDIKSLMTDLKKVYHAINEDEALNALVEFKEKWQKTYPSCIRRWEENWDILILSTFFLRLVVQTLPAPALI